MSADPIAPGWLVPPEDVSALESAVWPDGMARRDDGVAAVGGVGVDALAADFGTPLYVLDEEVACQRARSIRAAFADACAEIGTQSSVYYAGKAFLCTAVAAWMAREGLGIDVCSGGELAVALAAGVPAARVGFHGNNKSAAEIDRAVAAGVGTIVVDSEQEVPRVAEAAARRGVRQRVRLRVTSGVHAHTHEFLATAHEDQKFGVPLEHAERVAGDIRALPALEFVGLHCHIGSQIFGADGFAASAARLVEVHARLLRGGPVPELNLGGGFGIAYTSADEPMPIRELAQGIVGAVAAACRRAGIPVPLLAFEPGRWIIGPAGITLYTVGTTKPVRLDGGRRLYVSVDGGMSDNARPALYDADYTAALLGRRGSAGEALARVVGKHCESGDIVVSAGYLPEDIRPGDLLGVAATGAYCWELASNYNYLPRPAVVAVTRGRARVIVRGESEADLLARDPGADGSSREEASRA